MRAFNENIKRIIEKFSYNFFVVQQDFHIYCSCIDFTTKQGDPSCPKCLGTGYKIRIKKIRGVSEDNKGTFRNQGVQESTISTVYYIDAKYPVFQDNIIVDDQEAYTLYHVENKKTTNKELVYAKCMALNKKGDVEIFMKNFDKIIGRD